MRIRADALNSGGRADTMASQTVALQDASQALAADREQGLAGFGALLARADIAVKAAQDVRRRYAEPHALP